MTAENVADSHGISRDAQDEFALESHRRAQAAMEAGRFDEEVVPIEVKARKGAVEFSVDEHVRRDASLETFAKLKPAFKKDGTVTAGNASGVNDAAAAQSLAVVQDLGLDPAKVNPNGGAIALGHPIAATGVILTVKILNEMERNDHKLGLVSLCIGGGQGIAMLLKRD